VQYAIHLQWKTKIKKLQCFENTSPANERFDMPKAINVAQDSGGDRQERRWRDQLRTCIVQTAAKI